MICGIYLLWHKFPAKCKQLQNSTPLTTLILLSESIAKIRRKLAVDKGFGEMEENNANTIWLTKKICEI